MCGIAGIVQFGDSGEIPEIARLCSMVSALRHRGPDEFGYYRDNHAGLAHARLSLIDLVSGQQPQANEDGTLWISFNGEIFNYIELRAELHERGHVFRTASDTEVILHAYEEWGDDCFSRFNGQWALALWNCRKRTLVLSRDRVGICPLFVHCRGSRLWFASEVKALFADPRVPREIDPRGMDQTFRYWASVAPVSLFREVEELPPATIRTYDSLGRVQQKTFWYPRFSGKPEHSGHAYSFGEATEELRERLHQATKLRVLRADVPVGSYLSGGLDSSLTAWMGRAVKDGDFRTFSLRFEDAEFDETHYQRLMAATLDSNHVEIMATRSEIAGIFPEVVFHAERPILRTAPAPMFILSRAVREAGIKAVLTGEGADEFFGGYDIFREAKIREFWAHQPESTVRPLLFDRIYPYLARSPQHAKGMALAFWKRGLERVNHYGFSHEPRWSTTAALQQFFSTDLRAEISRHPGPDVLDNLPPEFGTWELLGRGQYLEVVTLLSTYLLSSQGDRMLMAHGVEGRFPFLDAEVITMAGSLPSDYKLVGLDEKKILKQIARDVLPASIVNRKKQAYRAPEITPFLGPESPAYVAEAFSEDALQKAGLLNAAACQKLYAKCLRQMESQGAQTVFSNTDNMSFIGILTTQLLHEKLLNVSPEGAGVDIRFNVAVDTTTQQIASS